MKPVNKAIRILVFETGLGEETWVHDALLRGRIWDRFRRMPIFTVGENNTP